MKKIKSEVHCDDSGQVVAVRKVYDIGPKTIHINGAGTKSIIVNHLLKFVTTNGIVNSINNYTSNSSTVYNNNNNNNTISGNISPTADAVDLTVVAVDRCFDELGLIDTHVFLNSVQFMTDIDYYIQLVYKCAIVQHSNYVKAIKHLCPDEYDELIPDVNDIDQTLQVWISRLYYTESFMNRHIKEFVKQLTDDSIANDYQKYKNAHHWIIRKWIDGKEHHLCRLLRYPDDHERCIRVSCYGGKDYAMPGIVTYDGLYCLKMPWDIRRTIQYAYEEDPRQFKKDVIALMKDKFTDTVDVNGEPHNFKQFFIQLSKRTVKPMTSRYEDAINEFKNLLAVYPDQTEAKKFIINNNVKEL